MSSYLLYGKKIVENDDTMEKFAESIIQNVPVDDLSSDIENYEDMFMERVDIILKYDLSRTDINYERLMYNFRNELGDLLYNLDNHWFELGPNQIRFFGEEAEESFNKLMYLYIKLKVFYK